MSQPITSILAHKKVKSEGKDKTHADLIYDTLVARRNMTGTASDIATFCSLDYTEVNRRMSELLAAGRIEVYSKNGGRTGSGNPCRIYRAVVVGDQPAVNNQPSLFDTKAA